MAQTGGFLPASCHSALLSNRIVLLRPADTEHTAAMGPLLSSWDTTEDLGVTEGKYSGYLSVILWCLNSDTRRNIRSHSACNLQDAGKVSLCACCWLNIKTALPFRWSSCALTGMKAMAMNVWEGWCSETALGVTVQHRPPRKTPSSTLHEKWQAPLKIRRYFNGLTFRKVYTQCNTPWQIFLEWMEATGEFGVI